MARTNCRKSQVIACLMWLILHAVLSVALRGLRCCGRDVFELVAFCLLLLLNGALLPAAGTPLWKLVLSQFDDMLVKVCLLIGCMQPAAGSVQHCLLPLTHRTKSVAAVLPLC